MKYLATLLLSCLVLACSGVSPASLETPPTVGAWVPPPAEVDVPAEFAEDDTQQAPAPPVRVASALSPLGRKIARSVVRIRMVLSVNGEERSFGGSGFAVTPRIVWTARHVVDPEAPAGSGGKVVRRFVTLGDGTTIPIVHVVMMYGDSARATLARPHGLPLLPIAKTAPASWAPAMVVGFPELQRWPVSVRGHARARDHEALARIVGAPNWLEMTLPLVGGLSGAPVLMRGAVAGVVSCDCYGPHTWAARVDRATLAEWEATLGPPEPVQRREAPSRRPGGAAGAQGGRQPPGQPPRPREPVGGPPECDDGGT